MEDYSVIGKSLPRVDAVVKATGDAKFTVDMVLPRTLYGKILRSPYPHARILNIDTSKAKSLGGVKAVITGKDTLGIKYGTIDVPPYPADKNPLVTDKVRYIGDEVAAVAAIDEDIAEEALDLIDVEYEELPPVFDPEEAMKPGAPKIHDSGNICAKISWDFGDVEKGFKEADLIREDRFETGPIAHCAMEPHAALASFDSSGKLTVWSSTQTPYMRRSHLAKTLGMRESKIRVLYTHVGGGFGGKTVLCEPDFQAALLSRLTGCPVKIVYTREEVFTCTMQRHPMVLHLKTGVKKDGTLIATQCKNIADGGAYAATGPIVMYLAGAFLVTVYRLANVSYEGYRVYTNKPIRGPQRGHGAVQPRFAFDSQLDMIAEELGMDPMEIRLKNAVRSGDITPNRFKVRGCGLTETIEKSSEMAGWKKKRGKMPGNRGIGMCCGTFVSGMLIPPHTSSAAFIKVHEDGGVTLMTGIPEIGQGSDTITSQIVADELGIALEDVQVVSGDTEITPPHAGSYSSRGTLWAGKAVKAAAFDAKQQLFKVVAQELEANPEDLEARDRRIYVKGSPEKGISFKDAVLASYMSKEGNPILGRGFYRPDIDLVNFETGEGNLSPDYSFGTQIAEVEVDKETGQVKLLKMIAAHDAGVVINPMAIEGQTEGSVSMGQGQVLYEDVIVEEGRVLNPSFLNYGLPTSMETADIKSIMVESGDLDDSFAPKEAGEGMQITTPAAIANAVYDAVGVRIKELPITPEKILKALAEKERGRG